MSPRFAYVYFMKDYPDQIRQAVPGHVAHWHGLNLADYLGGPFDDRSGGLITFEADQESAQQAVESDPFVLGGLLETHTLKRWVPE